MDSTNKRIKALLSRVFGGATVEDLPREGQEDVWPLGLHGRFGNVRLDAVWIGAGWPADVDQALHRLPLGPEQSERLVLTAQQMSPGAVEMLAERQVNWADEAGNASLQGRGFLVLRERPSERKPTPTVSWSDSAVAVAEALLARDWPDGVGTTELAELVQWSPARISTVLRSFDEAGWTVKYGPQRGSGAVRELLDPSQLLDSWATAVSQPRDNRRMLHRTMRAPLEFLETELAGALNEEVRWALGGWGAAHLLAPMAGTVPSLQIYVHEDDFAHAHDENEQPLERALRSAGLADVAEGGRVALRPAHPSVLTLAQPHGSFKLASPPRVYADLLSIGGRGKEAALHLRDELIDLPTSPHDRRPPEGLSSWEQLCRRRLDHLSSDRPRLASAYARGTWSASYRLMGMRETPSAGTFVGMLREVRGHETGWPTWLVPDSEAGPHLVDGMIECWFSETVFEDAAHADFWRADPHGRLCLIRGYQEDSRFEAMAEEPATRLDLTLPILRTGECLRHAERLANRLDATAVQMMMHWTGLKGRSLAAITSRDRWLDPKGPATQDEVVSFIEASPAEIGADLGAAARQLVAPLFEVFDFYEPPEELYAEELKRVFGIGS